MTTINHSALAGVVAVMTHDMPDTAKVVTLILLVVSHLPLDAIPHYHFYEFKRLRETWKGAVVELGGGFVLIPLLVWIFSPVDPLYLALCVFAANAFDLLIVAGVDLVKRLNHRAHWWYRFFNPTSGIICESIFFLTLVIVLIDN